MKYSDDDLFNNIIMYFLFLDDVPVLCSKDLKCPRLMKDLCTDFNYMILCCCSTNNNYYNIYSSS